MGKGGPEGWRRRACVPSGKGAARACGIFFSFVCNIFGSCVLFDVTAKVSRSLRRGGQALVQGCNCCAANGMAMRKSLIYVKQKLK